jgi:nucleoside-diphosphate-sugar epimerase
MLPETTLILGATGSFGGGIAQELLRRGKRVRCLVRSTARARRSLGESDLLELIEGDVQDASAVRRAAENCAVIVHGINYPYDQWIPHMERATESVIAAAREARAMILFPGNVYGLGAQTGGALDETAPNRPNSRKGELRVKLEVLLQRAAEENGARVLILRAEDYFGPTVRNGLVDPIFGNAARGKTIRALGRLDAPHQWAYMPDLAHAGVELLAVADRLAPFEVVNFSGHVASPHREFLELVALEAGDPGLAIQVAPWWLLRFLGLFNGVIRELFELRYLFDSAVILDDAKLRRLLPDFNSTPISEAVRTTLASYRAA